MSKLYTCLICKKKKQQTEFYLRKNGLVGEYKCKTCLLEKRKTYYRENYEEVRSINRKSVSKWQKRNKSKEAAKVAKYSANKKKALPRWVDNTELSKIRSLYKKAREISKITGIRHEVDHIIPINSKYICGLHTIYNLRVIPKDENLKKGNKILEDIVCTLEKSKELE